jgi:hypothetical protein
MDEKILSLVHNTAGKPITDEEYKEIAKSEEYKQYRELFDIINYNNPHDAVVRIQRMGYCKLEEV